MSKKHQATYKQSWWLLCYAKGKDIRVYEQADFKRGLTEETAKKIIFLLKSKDISDRNLGHQKLVDAGFGTFEALLPPSWRKPKPKPQPEPKPKPQPKPQTPTIPKYTPRLDGYIKPSIFDEICHLVKNKMDILIFGRAGTGKSLMAKAISTALEWNFFSINFTEGLRYSDIFEFTTLEDGRTVRKKTDLMKAFEVPGIVFLDEAFAIEPGVALGLNKLLQEGYYQARVGVIKRHEDCVVMLGANTMGRGSSQKYRGAKRADMSFLQRFIAYELDYDREVEKKIAERYLTEQDAKALLDKAWELRDKTRMNRIQFDVSTRAIEKACRIISQGFTIEKALEYAFYNQLTETDKGKLGVTK